MYEIFNYYYSNLTNIQNDIPSGQILYSYINWIKIRCYV